MKIRCKTLLLLAPGLLLMGCGPAKKPTVAQQPEAQATPSPSEATTSPADTNAPAGATAQAGDESRRQHGGGGGGGWRRGGGGDRGGDRLQRLASELNLTSEQSDKIKAIMEAQRPAMDAIRNDQSLSRDQRREKMQELRKTTDPQIAAILTPDQQAKWEEARAKMRAQMGNRQGGGEGSAPAASPTN